MTFKIQNQKLGIIVQICTIIKVIFKAMTQEMVSMDIAFYFNFDYYSALLTTTHIRTINASNEMIHEIVPQ